MEVPKGMGCAAPRLLASNQDIHCGWPPTTSSNTSLYMKIQENLASWSTRFLSITDCKNLQLNSLNNFYSLEENTCLIWVSKKTFCTKFITETYCIEMNEQIEEEFLNWKDKYNKDTSIQSETIFLNADEPKIVKS